MNQRQELHVRFPRQLRGLPRRRVAGLDRSLELAVGEAPIVHEQLGLVGGHPGHLARRGVPGDHDLAAAARLAHHLLGANLAVAPLHGLAGLKPAEVGAGLDPQARRQLGVEAPRPLVLDQRVAVGADLMLDLEAAHLVALVANRLALVELDQLDLVGDPAHDSVEGLEQAPQPGRPDDPQRALAALEVIGLQQPRQAEVVVGVIVGHVDLVHLDQARGALHLALRPLAAVEQQALAAYPGQQAGGGPPRGGHGAAGAEEYDREVHAPTVSALPPDCGRNCAAGREAIMRRTLASRPSAGCSPPSRGRAAEAEHPDIQATRCAARAAGGVAAEAGPPRATQVFESHLVKSRQVITPPWVAIRSPRRGRRPPERARPGASATASARRSAGGRTTISSWPLGESASRR